MKAQTTRFNAALEALATPLPASIAEGIGRTIARHSYLEWVLGQVLYSLLEISIKQGRQVVRRPSPQAYAAAVQGLFAFHKLEGRYDFADLATRLQRADEARDRLVNSVFMRDADSRKLRVHLVSASWSTGADLEVVGRDGWPETPLVDRALLARLRKDVEDAVTRAEKLRDLTDKQLRKLHERRRTNPQFNRRRRDR